MSQPLSGEYDGMGDFEAMLNLACDNAIMDDGEVFIHRHFDIEHLSGADCPCRPVIIGGDSLRKSSDLLAEVGSSDG